MATKKTDEAKVETMAVEEPVLEEPVEEKDPWKEKREIRLPKAPKGEDNFLIASVNGRVFKIKRGEAVEVPLPIAQVIENSYQDADAADEFIESKVFE